MFSVYNEIYLIIHFLENRGISEITMTISFFVMKALIFFYVQIDMYLIIHALKIEVHRKAESQSEIDNS